MDDTQRKDAAQMLLAYAELIRASGDLEFWHYIPEVEEMAAILAAANQASALPLPGWKAVPIEPTSAMLGAAEAAHIWHSAGLNRVNASRKAYEALLHHAPPLQPEGGE